LSLIYFNARSLIPKFDELCLIVSAHNPDIVAIVESWLCPDISDHEVCIPDYQLFRHDRNRHGGGVFLYIRDHLIAEVLPYDHTTNLEFLPVVIHHLGFKFCISVFYRPPNSSEHIFDIFCNVLASLNISVFSHFVLVGDFNVNINNTSHHLYHKVCSLVDYFNFTQVVSGFTHTAPGGSTSLIDLVFTTSPPQILNCATIPPLDNPSAKSYHLGLLLTINCKPPADFQGSRPTRRTVWHYKHADFAKASQMISETNWDDLVSEDIDLYCTRWQQTFLSIMEQCIPKRVLPPRKRNLPWLNKSLVQSMRRRNALFQKAKRSSNPIFKNQYRRARNRITAQLRHAKQKYFQNLNPSDVKHFWKTIKILNKQNAHGGSLTHNGISCSSDSDKASSLNDYFSGCFNTSHQPISTTTISGTADHECAPEILCTEDEICAYIV